MSQSQQLNLALIQMDITIGEPDSNFAHLEKLLLEAVQAAQKPDVLIFPEMWNTGYALTEIHHLADVNGERTKAFLSSFARTHRVNIIGGSIADKREDRVLNTIYAWDREGREIAEYSKIHLFRLMDEEKFLHSGEQLGLFELEGVPAGAMICYDIRFPELVTQIGIGWRANFVRPCGMAASTSASLAYTSDGTAPLRIKCM